MTATEIIQIRADRLSEEMIIRLPARVYSPESISSPSRPYRWTNSIRHTRQSWRYIYELTGTGDPFEIDTEGIPGPQRFLGAGFVALRLADDVPGTGYDWIVVALHEHDLVEVQQDVPDAAAVRQVAGAILDELGEMP